MKLPRKSKTWAPAPEGVQSKPPECRLCPNFVQGAGFARDLVALAPKIAIMREKPTKDEIFSQHFLAGGQVWKIRQTLARAGVIPETVLWTGTIRCYKFKLLGEEGRKAQRACRTHDAALLKFDPDIFIPTYDFADVRTQPPLEKVLIRHLAVANALARQGRRPILLMGKEVLHFVAPWAEGPFKGWAGSFWEGSWKEL